MTKTYLLLVLTILLVGTADASIARDLDNSRCWKSENTPTSTIPDGTTLCTLPDNLNLNDGNYEIVADGNRNRYEAIRTGHDFEFPPYCILTSVLACTDFYMAQQRSCTGISVSNTGGTSWSAAFGSCPTSDSGIVCYDVTTTLDWQCTNFQNNQSEILIRVQNSDPSPDLSNLYVDYLKFSINYTTPPNITVPAILPMYPNTTSNLNCSVNVTDAEETALTINFTWYNNSQMVNTYNSLVTCQNNTVCYTSILVPASATSVGDNWTCAAMATDGYANTSWRNSTVNIERILPILDNLSINNNLSINLLAGQNTTVICNGSYEDFGQGIATINATFYNLDFSQTPSSPINRSIYYSNSSCSYNSGQFWCSFSVDYYAVNGTWSCNVTAIDIESSSTSITAINSVNPLTAIGLSLDLIDYGQMRVNEESSEQSIQIINYGNINLDIRLYSYGLNEDDDLAMSCDVGTIPLEYQRFNISSGIDFEFMSMVQGKSSPIYLDFNLNRRTWDSSESMKPLYWKLKIPTVRGGLCSGKIIFSAFSG